jgi:hypothetical protein
MNGTANVKPALYKNQSVPVVPTRKYSPFSEPYLCEQDVKLYNLNPVLSTCPPDLKNINRAFMFLYTCCYFLISRYHILHGNPPQNFTCNYVASDSVS